MAFGTTDHVVIVLVPITTIVAVATVFIFQPIWKQLAQLFELCKFPPPRGKDRRWRMHAAIAFASVTVISCDRDFDRPVLSEAIGEILLRETARVDGSKANLVPADATRGLGLLTDGGVGLTQSMDGTVRIFGPAGDPRGTLGAKGQGPGEFAALSRVRVVGDSIWAWDGRLSRGTIFAREKFVRSFDLTHLRNMLLVTSG